MSFVQQFEQLSILIIGDIILDHYLFGEVNRISPEAPVPVVLHQREEYRLGGAANVALNMKSMRAKPYLLSILGQDHACKQIQQLFEEAQLPTEGLLTSPSRVTSIKTRVVAKNQQLLRYDKEISSLLTTQEQEQLLTKLTAFLRERKFHAIVLQDYNKGIFSPRIIKQIIALAQKQHIPVFVDPKKEYFWDYQNVYLFKPNLREIKDGLNININETSPAISEVEQAAQTILERLQCKYALITLGAHGMYLASKEKSLYTPTKAIKVADVCGAGDTVISLITLGFAAQLPLEEIVQLANLAGGIVCEENGVVPVSKERLLIRYKELYGEK